MPRAYRPERPTGDLTPIATILPEVVPTPEPRQPLSRTLLDILANPAVLEPPAVVVPRLAWKGRITLLAAEEKLGKSTLASAAAASVSSGASWLGDATPKGSVLWIAAEEHVGDLAARLHEWRADPTRIHIVDNLVGVDDPIAAVHEEARALTPSLVVIDTLAAIVEATGARPDPGSSTAWTPIMAALARIARETEAALVLLHHARRSDGRYRDSSAIGAGVDVIAEMSEGHDAGVRTLRVRARREGGDYTIRLDRRAVSYELVTGELSLEARVLAYVRANPACSQRAVEKGIEGRAADIRAGIRQLLAAGALVNRGTEGAMRLHEAGTHADAQSDATGTHVDEPSGRIVRPEAEPRGCGSGRTSEREGKDD